MTSEPILRLYFLDATEPCGVVQNLDENRYPIHRALIHMPEKPHLAEASEWIRERVFRVDDGPPFRFVSYTGMYVGEEGCMVLEGFTTSPVKLPPEKDVFDPEKGGGILGVRFTWREGFWEGGLGNWTVNLAQAGDGGWVGTAYLTQGPRLTVHTNGDVDGLDRMDPYDVLDFLREKLASGLQQEAEWHLDRADEAAMHYEDLTGELLVDEREPV